MTNEPAPAFQFYVKDWRSSRKVQAMSFAERGMYFEMLLEQWETGSVPASSADLAMLLGGSESVWSRAMPRLSQCFMTRRHDGRLVNAKLEAVRRAKNKFKKAQSENGVRGAMTRWRRHGKAMGLPSNGSSDSMANDGSSSSSLPSSSSSSSTADGTELHVGSGKKPIFNGQRLVVFEWQRRDLARMLGSLTAEFDLGAWFVTLDQQAVEAQCAIPQRDGGAWLQAATLAEVQRRGLPIAAPQMLAAGKQTTRLAAAIAKIQAEEPV
jgi:uncharacterized protein YdaU (DUF1376 family)